MEVRVPAGFRDLTVEETRKKTILQKKVEKIFTQFGYQNVETPSIEYFSTYANAFDDVENQSFFQFFDNSGQTLALRSDMTVPIARVCATKYANAKPPFRFSYHADVYKVRHVFGGKRSQVTDCGIELIGLDEKSDIEVLYIASSILQEIAPSQYQLEIGNSGFFKKACELLNISDLDQKKLADYIDRKSLVDLQSFLDTIHLSDVSKEFFATLPLLVGKKDALEKAYEIAFHPELKSVVTSLTTLYDALCELGVGDNISFDFGKIPHLEYYTGIIFEGFVNGVATSVLSGGRYDDLLAKFSRNLPACGFSIKLDYCLDICEDSVQKIVQIRYPIGKEVQALKKASELQKDNAVQLIPADINEIEVIE